MVCTGFEHGSAGWKAQTKPQIRLFIRNLCTCSCKKIIIANKTNGLRRNSIVNRSNGTNSN